MKEKIRRWCVENPRAMDAAYVIALGSSILFELSTQDVSGTSGGP